MIYLVRADARCEERVSRGTAFFEKSKIDSLVQLNGKLGLREVFLNFPHRVFLDTWVVRLAVLGLVGRCFRAEASYSRLEKLLLKFNQ